MNHYRSLLMYSAIAWLSAGVSLTGAAVNIIPQPSTLTLGTGNWVIDAASIVTIYTDAGSDSTSPWVEKLFKQAKCTVSRAANATDAKVTITIKQDAALGTEGYKLSITATQVAITAPTLIGQFYAVQTLRQMFPVGIEDSTSGITGPITLSQLEITDKPRLEYRGSMIDPVRHFLPLPYLYQHLDRMALFKLNRLHLLLSNDQGFRMESKLFPLLHEKGSLTQVGGAHPPAGQRWYYTQDEMRAVVKYAAYRKIQIIPEIDMPGHCMAMCFAYPQLGTPNSAVQTDEQVGLSILNVSSTDKSTRPQVFNYVHTFIGQLWREMSTIFTAEHYQMGGDECFNIDKPGFTAFAQAVQDTLAKLGKKTIAWDEVAAAGGLRANNWSQDWHQGANIGNIMSSCQYFYLDHHNETGDGANVLTWCAPEVTLQSVYTAPLTYPALKGVEGVLFGERLTVYPDYWDRQIWPRLSAVAENGWVANNNGFSGYVARLGSQGSRFSTMGVKYFSTKGVTWVTATTNTKMTNLYDGFVPTIGLTGIAGKNSGRKMLLATKGQKTYNTLGRVVQFSRSGHPEAAKFVIKP